jgi:hypothetical protein
MVQEVHQDEMAHLDHPVTRVSKAFLVPLDFKDKLGLLDCQ